jgi:hypothetical protein
MLLFAIPFEMELSRGSEANAAVGPEQSRVRFDSGGVAKMWQDGYRLKRPRARRWSDFCFD